MITATPSSRARRRCLDEVTSPRRTPRRCVRRARDDAASVTPLTARGVAADGDSDSDVSIQGVCSIRPNTMSSQSLTSFTSFERLKHARYVVLLTYNSHVNTPHFMKARHPRARSRVVNAI